MVNRGFLNQPLLEKDIELMSLYADDENSKISELCGQVDRCIDTYSSPNNRLLSTSVDNIRSQLSQLRTKRTEYEGILRQVIERYNEASSFTTHLFQDKEEEII